MQDRPTREELLETAQHFLEDQVVLALDGRSTFHARQTVLEKLAATNPTRFDQESGAGSFPAAEEGEPRARPPLEKGG